MPRVVAPPSTLEIANEEPPSRDWYNFFFNLYEYCRGDYDVALGGIFALSNQEVTNSGGLASDLVDYIFERRRLIEDGDSLGLVFRGTYAANANNKRIVISFGSQTIFDTGALAINGGAWIFEATVTRTSANTQNIFVKAFYNNVAQTAFVSGVQDLESSDIDIKLTATGVANNDIALKEYYFNINPIG